MYSILPFTIASGFLIQFRVIGALIMREMYTRFGRENLGFLWLAGEPILFIGGVLLVRSYIQGGVEHGVPLIVVISTGYPALVMWRNCIFRTVNCMRFNYGLLFHRQVLPVDLLISRLILEILGVVIATLICYGFLLLIGAVKWPYDPAVFLLGWFFHIWFSFASGLLVGAISEMTDIIEKFVHVFTYLWLPIGGSFFMVSWLPYRIRNYAELIPSVDAYELTRSGYFGPSVDTYYNILYLSECCLVMTVVGLFFVKLSRRLMVIE